MSFKMKNRTNLSILCLIALFAGFSTAELSYSDISEQMQQLGEQVIPNVRFSDWQFDSKSGSIYGSVDVSNPDNKIDVWKVRRALEIFKDQVRDVGEASLTMYIEHMRNGTTIHLHGSLSCPDEDARNENLCPVPQGIIMRQRRESEIDYSNSLDSDYDYEAYDDYDYEPWDYDYDYEPWDYDYDYEPWDYDYEPWDYDYEPWEYESYDYDYDAYDYDYTAYDYDYINYDYDYDYDNYDYDYGNEYDDYRYGEDYDYTEYGGNNENSQNNNHNANGYEEIESGNKDKRPDEVDHTQEPVAFKYEINTNKKPHGQDTIPKETLSRESKQNGYEKKSLFSCTADMIGMVQSRLMKAFTLAA